MDERRIAVVKDLDVANTLRASEALKYMQSFADTANVFHAPIETPSKSFWFVLV